jgi:hypothetical protein
VRLNPPTSIIYSVFWRDASLSTLATGARNLAANEDRGNRWDRSSLLRVAKARDKDRICRYGLLKGKGRFLMDNEAFSFTPEQKDNLRKWMAFLDTDGARRWALEEKDAIGRIKNIFQKAGFRGGKDLSAEQLDDVFRNMQKLIRNLALNRRLYEDNGLTNFNSKLRTLLFSSEPLAKRVNQFFELKWVRILTLSQFLCSFSPTEYPEIGWQTLEVLDLDSSQSESAYRQALREHNISQPQDYRDDTIEYLKSIVIFRNIKNLLNIDLYTSVNDMLWFVYSEANQGVESFPSTVSLEVDLRDRLAEKPSLIERGLSLIGKEYPIARAGKADLVCKDKRGNYVVIETKKGRESDKVVGQILRYIGGLKKEGKPTRGIIVVNEPDEKLDFAIEAVKDFVRLKYYKVSFDITDSYTDT